MDIADDEDRVVCIQSLMNSSEDLVGLRVLTPSGPPAFNDTIVVTIDLDSGKRARLENSVDEEFHGDGLSSSNVPPILVPPRQELPGMPSVSNDNAEASC